MFTILVPKIMRHQNKFLALLIVNICLLGIFNSCDNKDLNLENLRAHVKFGSGSPIKVIPAPTWKEVGNVFLKRSFWKENENSNKSEIKGCTKPKVGVNNMYILIELLRQIVIEFNETLDLAFDNVKPKDWYLSLIRFNLGQN